MRPALLLLFLVMCGWCAAAALPSQGETCGAHNEVKVMRTEVNGKVDAENFYYVPVPGGDGNDDDYLLALTRDNQLYNSTDGGATWELQNPLMEGADVDGPPVHTKGVHAVSWSADGTRVYATSWRFGFWLKDGGAPWSWIATGTDYVVQMVPHPHDRNLIAAIFVTESCFEHGVCKRPLRVSRDGGRTWSDLDKQGITAYWSTRDATTLFYSAHYDQDGDWNKQDWYHSRLYRVAVGATATGAPQALVDHERGFVYLNGTLIAAQSVAAGTAEVFLVTSVDDGVTIDRAIFREFGDSEIENAQAYNLIDVSNGSIFVNVRKDRDDRGDLYVSGAFDHDFTLVLANNVRKGSRGDVARLASLRGIYVANIWDDITVTPMRKRAAAAAAAAAVPASQANAREPPAPVQHSEIATGITFDLGGNWDFVPVPAALRSECNSTNGGALDWCGLHFLGRSNDDLGQSPYSPRGAIGIALATGNIGKYLDLDAAALGTYLTRDGGVTWKRIALGDNRYAVADRGGVLLWLGATGAVDSLHWSWDEGNTSSLCAFGTLGPLEVHALHTAPTRAGLRFHLLASDTADPPHHYIVSVDFSALRERACAPENYEQWVARDPDGAQGCLLGSQTTYLRRKQYVQCFNIDNDVVVSTVNCTCERDDYECDDCWERENFWDPASVCVPSSVCPNAAPNPCANRESTYLETRGYRRVPFDVCVSDRTDIWAPLSKPCVGGDTQSTSATVTSATSSGGVTVTPVTSKPTGTTTPNKPTTSAPTTAPAAGGGNYNGVIVAGLVGALLVGGLVAAAVVLRRNARFQAWVAQHGGGRVPAWLVPQPESPYATLGELEPAGALDEDF